MSDPAHHGGPLAKRPGHLFGPTLVAEHLWTDHGILVAGLVEWVRRRRPTQARRERMAHFGEFVQLDNPTIRGWSIRPSDRRANHDAVNPRPDPGMFMHQGDIALRPGKRTLLSAIDTLAGARVTGDGCFARRPLCLQAG